MQAGIRVFGSSGFVWCCYHGWSRISRSKHTSPQRCPGSIGTREETICYVSSCLYPKLVEAPSAHIHIYTYMQHTMIYILTVLFYFSIALRRTLLIILNALILKQFLLENPKYYILIYITHFVIITLKQIIVLYKWRFYNVVYVMGHYI